MRIFIFLMLVLFAMPVEAGIDSRVGRILSLLEASLTSLEAGTPLTAEQRRFLFPEVPLEEYPYFWELNGKDRRVQRLRRLIEENTALSTREKEIFFSRTSGDAERSAYEDLSIGGMVLPILLPREDWAEEFKKDGPPWRRQKEIMEELVQTLMEYEVSLRNPADTKILEAARIVYAKALQNVLTLSPPKSAEEHGKACAYFYKEVWPSIRDVQKKEMDILMNNREFIFLIRRTNELAGGSSNNGSYLIEYKILEEIRERIEKRKAKEKS